MPAGNMNGAATRVVGSDSVEVAIRVAHMLTVTMESTTTITKPKGHAIDDDSPMLSSWMR